MVVRFENRLNKDDKKFKHQNPVWDNEINDALNVFEIIDLLNKQDYTLRNNEMIIDGLMTGIELRDKEIQELKIQLMKQETVINIMKTLMSEDGLEMFIGD